jgi:tetratricopeptide (TPR) repeat protein
MDDAVVEGHTASDLDPASVSVRRSLAHTYYYARRYDQAIYHIERAIALDPNAAESHRLLGLFLAQQGQLEEAERVLRDGLELPGAGVYPLATMAYVLARAGRPEEARVVLGRLEEDARHGYVSPVAFGMIHLGLGNSGRVFEAMERAYAERRGWLAYLKVNPLLDPLRADPRFGEFVERMGLNG